MPGKQRMRKKNMTLVDMLHGLETGTSKVRGTRSLPEAFLASRGQPSKRRNRSSASYASPRSRASSASSPGGGGDGNGFGACLGDALVIVRRFEVLFAKHPTLATDEQVSAFRPLVSELADQLGVNSG